MNATASRESTPRRVRAPARARGATLVRIIVRYLLAWTAIFAIQALVAPRWLVGTRNGLQTLFQVVPSAVVAVLVLVLGSVFAIAQLAISAYGSRAVIVLLEDEVIRDMVVRPFVLLAASLLLAGAVPDTGRPSAVVTAAAATIVLATLTMVARTIIALPARLAAYTAPRNFVLLVVKNVPSDLEIGFTASVVFKLPLLGEMVRACVRRGDTVGVIAALKGLEEIQLAYLESLPRQPSIAAHPLDDGTIRDDWFADEFALAHVAAGEEALRHGGAERETDAIAEFLGSGAISFAKHGRSDDAVALAHALARLAVTSFHVSPTTVNIYALPADYLASLEAAAELAGLTGAAEIALAAWLLAVSYPQYHFGAPEHPLWKNGIAKLGPSPPWPGARRVIESPSWQERYANKQYQGPEPLVDNLRRAEAEHRQRSE